MAFHVLNRGVRRMRLFDRARDYADFLEIFGEAQERTPMRCLAYCLMPNHFHLVVWPRQDGDLSAFMFWFTTKHAKRWHLVHGTAGTGAVYQNRFKAFPISADDHFLRVCRYVERNALRAGLVTSVEDWPWSSVAQRLGRWSPVRLEEWPVPRPPDWLEMLDREDSRETAEIRRAVRRSAPYGPELWRENLAPKLGLEKSLRPIGRPPTPSLRKVEAGRLFDD